MTSAKDAATNYFASVDAGLVVPANARSVIKQHGEKANLVIWLLGAPAPPSEAPVNTSLPTIDNMSPSVDAEVTADPGTWDPEPDSYAYQWYTTEDGITFTPITGATSSTFTPTTDEFGYMLAVGVVATKDGHSSDEVMSDCTEAMGPSRVSALLEMAVENVGGIGSNVASWPDSSGTSSTPSNSNVPTQPVVADDGNGNPAVQFDGIATHLDGTLTAPPTGNQDVTIYSVANFAAGSGVVFFFGASLVGRAIYYPLESGGNYVFAQYGADVHDGAMPHDQWVIFTATKASGVVTLYINGVPVISDSPGATDWSDADFSIGTANGEHIFSGLLKQHNLFGVAHDTTTRQQWEQYLASKYAITLPGLPEITEFDFFTTTTNLVGTCIVISDASSRKAIWFSNNDDGGTQPDASAYGATAYVQVNYDNTGGSWPSIVASIASILGSGWSASGSILTYTDPTPGARVDAVDGGTGATVTVIQQGVDPS